MQLTDDETITPGRKLSQRARILNYLLQGGELTSCSMLERFGAYDGRKRISELRRLGYPILDRRGHSANASFNIYYMERNGAAAPASAAMTN